jgi:hypothetical protein
VRFWSELFKVNAFDKPADVSAFIFLIFDFIHDRLYQPDPQTSFALFMNNTVDSGGDEFINIKHGPVVDELEDEGIVFFNANIELK